MAVPLKPRALDIEGLKTSIRPLPCFKHPAHEGQGDRPGGGDSAVDWALLLDKIAQLQSFTVGTTRALEHSVEELKHLSVSIETPFVSAA